MRIPIATDLSTRDGTGTKDAKLSNAFIDDGMVFKRPSSQGGVSVGTGTAQGGIGFYIGSTPYFVGVWGDTLVNYTGGGTNWNSGTTYPVGSMISYNFINYWAINENTDSQPPSVDWSTSFVPEEFIPIVGGWTFGAMSYPPTLGYLNNNPIAYNGAKYVYFSNATNTISSSIDGLSWVDTYDSNLYWNAKYSVAVKGSMFCAVNSWTSYSAVSLDGVSWTHTFSTYLGTTSDIACNGSIFCATATAGNFIIYSTDGLSWTPVPYATIPNQLSSICWNGSVFCATELIPSSSVWVSPDGINWTSKSLPVVGTFNKIKSVNGVFVAIQPMVNTDVYVYSVDNGVTWTDSNLIVRGYTMASNGSRLLVFPVVTASYYFYTDDGINWNISDKSSSFVASSVGSGGAFIIMDDATTCGKSITGI